MIRRKKEDVEWLEFELLQKYPEIVHGVFLRSIDMIDPKATKKLMQIVDCEKIYRPSLIHGDRVEQVPREKLDNCDGLMTNEPNLALAITHADCQAAIFYDPIEKVIANVHCGWRGNVQNIYGKTVKRLHECFGSKPENLIVCISPSLGPDHSEFVHFEKELPKTFLKYQVYPTYFDLWEIAKAQLQEAGVQEKQIEIAQICTYCEKKDFFSHRREKKTGRHGTVVKIKN